MIVQIFVSCFRFLFVRLYFLSAMRLTLLIPAVVDARIIRFVLEAEANKVSVIDGWSHWVDSRDGGG